MDKTVASKFAAKSKSMGKDAMKCVTTTFTETVTTTITETIDVIKTAEKQYQECYDKEVKSDTCKLAGPGAGACAAGICALKSFVDIVVGFITVVTTTTEDVVRTVVLCVKPIVNQWPNPWTLLTNLPVATVSQPETKVSQTDIGDAIKFLKNFKGVFGAFGTCLLNGQWSLAQLETPLEINSKKVIFPYGIRVCITADCARQLAIENTFGELTTSWVAALSALAALSPEFAAAVAAIGITPAAAVAALVASAPEVVVGIAAVILAFIILALIYGTAVSGQLSYQVCCTSNLDDGTVCIEHPTFAIALLSFLTLGNNPTVLIPPIVTG